MAGKGEWKNRHFTGLPAACPAEQNKAHEGRRVIIGKNKRPAEGSDSPFPRVSA